MEYRKQDITTIEGPAIIIHGVNCQGKMGSGVAKAISDKWPAVKEEYLRSHDITFSGNRIDRIPCQLGDVEYIEANSINDIYVVNCYTQEFYGYDGKKYADLSAIRTCIDMVCRIYGYDRNIFSPKIGCGLGGLDWETEVKPIYEEIEKQHPVNFIICEI